MERTLRDDQKLHVEDRIQCVCWHQIHLHFHDTSVEPLANMASCTAGNTAVEHNAKP